MTGDTVVVAMSGGVDSAVAAALLKERGFAVYGVTMRLWCYLREASAPRACCSLAAIGEAQATARRLGIPHAVLDLESEFTEHVIQPFIEEYREGRTPNPCVRCNSGIKFGALRERGRELGARFIATGHYAQVESAGGRVVLKKARDATKDQSYALWGLERRVLGEVLLPLGPLTKGEVRQRARALELPVADRPESQDVCFVEGGDYADFLERRVGEVPQAAPGPIVDESGRVLGTHRGVIRYTVGQRKGLGLARPAPTYVVRIEAATNTLVVGDEAALGGRSFEVRDANFVSIDPPAAPFRAEVRVRYRGGLVPATVSARGAGAWRIDLDRAARAVTPGQSAVFYDGDVLLGGAVIERLIAGEEAPG